MPRPSYAQVEALVDFLEKNPGVARRRTQTSSAKAETKKKWSAAAVHINSKGGVMRDGVGWAKYWAERKCALKKLCASQNASIRCSKGLGETLPPFSALDQRMISVMGGLSVILEDSVQNVDPFPDSNMSSMNMDETSEIDSPIQALGHLKVEICENNEELLQTSSPPTPSTSPPYPPTPPHPHTSPPHPSGRPRPAPYPRRHRSRVPSRGVEAEMKRLAEIESRRLKAEMMTATAFQKLSEVAERITVAQESAARAHESMSSALSVLAAAVADIAKKLPT